MDIMEAISKSLRNLPLIETSPTCGCYKCCKVFTPNEIKDWAFDQTAICPFCNAESIIPGVTEEELKEIKKSLAI